MSPTTRWSLSLAASAALLGSLLLSGCAAAPAPQPVHGPALAYQITPSPFKIDASARVEATVTITPELQPLWVTWFGNSARVETYLQGMAGAVTNDLAQSGLFARIEQEGPNKPDYLVRLQAREANLSNLGLQVTIQLLDPATGRELFARTVDYDLGLTATHNRAISFTKTPAFPPNTKNNGWSGLHLLTGSMKHGFEQVMPVMKAGIASYFQKRGEQAEAQRFQTASLTELIAGSDRSVSLARERNRAIIAAKNQQLPLLLRERKTAELTDLVTKIEQAILDLDHEGEVAKDRAQQAAATNESSGQIDEIRGLGICYRERIELLKPILAALKEEIANRNR